MGGVWQISLCGCRGQLLLHNETDESEINLEFYTVWLDISIAGATVQPCPDISIAGATVQPCPDISIAGAPALISSLQEPEYNPALISPLQEPLP